MSTNEGNSQISGITTGSMLSQNLNLPEGFKKNVSQAFGPVGDNWLGSLPEIIRKYQQLWEIKIDPAIHGLNYNYVAPATLKDGSQAIFKAGLPNPEFTFEIDALIAFAGKNIVRLLKYDKEKAVMLLEYLKPGTQLLEGQQQNDEQATQIAAQIIRDFPIPVPGDARFPTVVQWAEALDRVKGPRSSKELLAAIGTALAFLEELESSKSQNMLLHGDLHYENILFDSRRGWVLIDPKGVIGDPVYESARLLHNPIQTFLNAENPQAILKRRIEILASTLGADEQRIAKWAYFDCVLSACWSVEENSDPAKALGYVKLLGEILKTL